LCHLCLFHSATASPDLIGLENDRLQQSTWRRCTTCFPYTMSDQINCVSCSAHQQPHALRSVMLFIIAAICMALNLLYSSTDLRRVNEKIPPCLDGLPPVSLLVDTFGQFDDSRNCGLECTPKSVLFPFLAVTRQRHSSLSRSNHPLSQHWASLGSWLTSSASNIYDIVSDQETSRKASLCLLTSCSWS
jgi:hypothetical protein